MSEIILDNENFESEVINSEIPVLVDFWATWCGPCKMIAPFIERLANEYDGRLKVCKADVDQAADLAQAFNVSSIPTVLIFRNGDVVSNHVGAASYGLLEAMVKEALEI